MPPISTTEDRPAANASHRLVSWAWFARLRSAPPGNDVPIPPGRSRRKVAILAGAAVLVTILGIAYWINATARERMVPFDPTLYPKRMSAEEGELTLVPESERPLDRIVIGINQATGKYYLLPFIDRSRGIERKRLETVRKRLYLTDLEICHGYLWGVIPSETRIFVGVPRNAQGESATLERRWFREYLSERWGWSPERISRKVRFFDMPTFTPWTQDLGEVVGWDRQGRTVIVVGTKEPDYYISAVSDLVRRYPRDFTVRWVESAISTEGGDVEMAWGPEGRPQLWAGRHAAVRYVSRMQGVPAVQRPITLYQWIDSTQAYSAAFLGLTARFLPRSVLMDPRLGQPELFHMDMVATFFAGRNRPIAAVPYYLDHPVDAISGMELEPAFVRRTRGEYNRAALELSAAGYEVIRLPFADHPVRGPVNLVKYYDRRNDRQVVLLAKYPRHRSDTGELSDQARILGQLYDVQNKGSAWQDEPQERRYQELLQSIATLDALMKHAAVAPDPVFEAQRAVLEDRGFRVVPVPVFPWGAGGLHCLTLH